MPRDHCLQEWERQAIVAFHAEHPLEGYRRLTFMTMDADLVAASPATVYRVLKAAGRLQRWRPAKTTKGQGFQQPLAPHEHWHLDISYVNVRGTFYYLLSVLDGRSRFIVHWELRESMKESDVEVVSQRAGERFPTARPRIITGNGPQFIAKDFKEFTRLSGMTHVRASPYCPQSNGKLERWHGTLKRDCLRPHVPLSCDDARRLVGQFVEHYNHVQLLPRRPARFCIGQRSRAIRFMPILGAHQSIAGGYYKAVETAARIGCDCLQLFTKNNNQWRAKPIVEEDVAKFRAALTQHNIGHPLAHNSYLINMAAADGSLWKQSVDAFVVELERAEMLGIPYVVAHPGAYTSTSEEAGLAQIARALDEVHGRTTGFAVKTLLENTAGQGSSLGHRFEHLAEIIARVKEPDRLGVCIDTCHTFAAGYPLAPKKDYQATMRQLDAIVGLDRVRAFHLNDSKKPFGSRVDRHEHIGKGQLGLEPFRLLLADRRFRKIPMYLETPKEVDGEERGAELDKMNLSTLRGLAAKK